MVILNLKYKSWITDTFGVSELRSQLHYLCTISAVTFCSTFLEVRLYKFCNNDQDDNRQSKNGVQMNLTVIRMRISYELK